MSTSPGASWLLRFDIPKDYTTFFTPTERTQVVDYVLNRTGICQNSLRPLSSQDPQKDVNYPTQEDIDREAKTGARPSDYMLAKSGNVDLGVDRMVSEGVFLAAFPLHEVRALIAIGYLGSESWEESTNP